MVKWRCYPNHLQKERFLTEAALSSESCEGCPLKKTCAKAQGDREITVSLKYLRYKQQAREKLRSEEGHALSVQRMAEPESVFGQIKNNRGFRRFLLRGLHKVSLEVGWLSLAHNLSRRRPMIITEAIAVWE
ncbi:transposase [Paenibacillus lautus]|uniref:transposase n=1 Tax=Paenibacillus lautus TaxID=1401 RepID=UPI003D2AF60C